MLAVKGFNCLFSNEKLIKYFKCTENNTLLSLTSSSLPGLGDEWLVPGLKALGLVFQLCGTSRGGVELGSERPWM